MKKVAARTFPDGGAAVIDRTVAERRKVLNSDYAKLVLADSSRNMRSDIATSKTETKTSFADILANSAQKCPYEHLAKDGLIQYNGVTFVCDYERNAICLGDMNNPKDVLTIALPSGGSLKVNVHNFGDLSKAAGMFSPKDLNAIMRAISQYNHCVSTVNEIEEEEINGVKTATEVENKKETVSSD